MSPCLIDAAPRPFAMPSANAAARVNKDAGGNSSVPISTRKSRLLMSSSFRSHALQHREPQCLASLVIGFGDFLRQRAHPEDEALTFGDRDRLASIEQVERM